MDNVNKPLQPITPTSAPSFQALKKKLNPVLIIVVLITVVILMISAIVTGVFYLVAKQSGFLNKTELDTSPQQTIDLIPQMNSIYLGTYQGKDALFITDGKKQIYNEQGVQKTSVFVGELETIEGTGYKSFDFKMLNNPKMILTSSTKPIFSINNFIMNKSENIVYVSINYSISGPDMLNSILQIAADGSVVNELWSNNIGSNKYPNGQGIVYLKQVVDDKYLVFEITDCYGCEAMHAGTIVLNIPTRNEGYYEMAGNVQINLEAGTLSYQKLAPFQEVCEGCENGQTTVLKPTGQILTENLPSSKNNTDLPITGNIEGKRIDIDVNTTDIPISHTGSMVVANGWDVIYSSRPPQPGFGGSKTIEIRGGDYAIHISTYGSGRALCSGGGGSRDGLNAKNWVYFKDKDNREYFRMPNSDIDDVFPDRRDVCSNPEYSHHIDTNTWGDYFSSNEAAFGNIFYSTPDEADDAILNLMDNMVASFESTR